MCVGICPRLCSICIRICKHKYKYKYKRKENENKNCWPVCVSVFVQGCVAGGQNGRGGGSSLKFVPTPIHDVFHVYLLAYLDVSRLCIAKYSKVHRWLPNSFLWYVCLNASTFLCFFFSFSIKSNCNYVFLIMLISVILPGVLENVLVRYLGWCICHKECVNN